MCKLGGVVDTVGEQELRSYLVFYCKGQLQGCDSRIDNCTADYVEFTAIKMLAKFSPQADQIG